MTFVAKVNSKHLKIAMKKKIFWKEKKLNVVRSQVPSVTHVDYSARIGQLIKKQI